MEGIESEVPDEVPENRERRPGRPLKPSSGDAVKDNRRAQVRKAQRAYQQQKSALIRHTDQDVLKLQQSIDNMSEAVLNFSDDALQREAVTAGSTTAYNLQAMLREMLSIYQEYSPPSLDDTVGKTPKRLSPTDAVEQNAESGPSVEIDSPFSFGTAPNPVTDLAPVVSQPVLDSSTLSYSYSPLANASIWLPVSPSPTPSRTYNVHTTVIAGIDSFPGRLYWTTISQVHNLFTSTLSISQTQLQRIYTAKLRYWKLKELQRMTETILNQLTLRTATFESEMFADEAVRVCIEGASAAPANYEERASQGWEVGEGERVSRSGAFTLPSGTWMDVYDVERYLSQECSSEITSTTLKSRGTISSRQTPQIVEGWFAQLPGPGFKQEERRTYDIANLMDTLAIESVQMAEGPRFEASKVQEIVQGFLEA